MITQLNSVPMISKITIPRNSNNNIQKKAEWYVKYEIHLLMKMQFKYNNDLTH